MTLLPIVTRELRVAARRPKSYWTRVLVAGVGMLLLGWTLWMARYGWRWTSPATFQLLAWCAFAYCLFSGALATADCLSAERRENTVGLLFLTDLKGYDVVVGKLFGHSVSCLFGLGALLPVLAVPVMMGGVQYAEFWRVAVALITTLLLSLAAGLLISAFCKNGFHATAISLVAMLLIGFGLPLLALLFQYYFKWQSLAAISRLATPFWTQTWAFSASASARSNLYGWSVLVNQLLALTALVITCWVWPRTWRENSESPRRFSLRALLRGPKTRLIRTWGSARAVGKGLLEKNPLAWLACHQGMSALACLLWFAVPTTFCGWLANEFEARGHNDFRFEQLFAWILTGILLHFTLMVMITLGAAQRLGEDRGTGALELLVTTPVTVRALLRGIWAGLRRQLGGSILIVLLVHLVVLNQLLLVHQQEAAFTSGEGPTWKLVADILFFWPQQTFAWETSFMLACAVAAGIGAVLHWITLGWVTMWLALRLHQPRLAPWAALATVLAPPWALFILGVIGLLEFQASWAQAQWLSLCLKLLLLVHILSDAALSVWAWRQLRYRFRSVIAERAPVLEGRALWRAWLRRAAWAAAAGAAGIGLLGFFHLEENWRGKRAWDQLQRRLQSRSESVAIASIAPPPLLPEQNFADVPLIAEVFQMNAPRLTSSGSITNPAGALRAVSLWLTGQSRGYIRWDRINGWAGGNRTDFQHWRDEYRSIGLLSSNGPPASPSTEVLQCLRRFDPVLAELRTASQRPFCRYPIDYNSDWNTPLPHLEVLDNVSEVLRFRACALLEAGNTDAAVDDTLLCFYLAESLQGEPFLQSLSLRNDLLGAALQPIWEGLASHCWSDEQLGFLQARLAEVNVLASCPLGIQAEVLRGVAYWTYQRAERARKLGLWHLTRVLFPEGWTYQNQVELYHVYETELVAQPTTFVLPAQVEAKSRLWYSRNSRITLPAWGGWDLREITHHFARAETAIRQARIACSLERCRIARGQYPATLEALVPQFLEQVSMDPIGGRPWIYRRLSPTQFLLYSVGWDDKDSGGRGQPEADWVWRYTKR